MGTKRFEELSRLGAPLLKPQMPWLRVFVEGVVIVGSILLAFGIDAAWEGVHEREDERASLELLSRDLSVVLPCGSSLYPSQTLFQRVAW